MRDLFIYAPSTVWGLPGARGSQRDVVLSWLTNSALEPKSGGRGELRGLSQRVQYNCAHGAQINFGDLTPYLTCRGIPKGLLSWWWACWFFSTYVCASQCRKKSWKVSSHTAKTKCRNIPRKGISGPQSQFPHSCVCERIIYSHDGSAFSTGGNMSTDPGNI